MLRSVLIVLNKFIWCLPSLRLTATNRTDKSNINLIRTIIRTVMRLNNYPLLLQFAWTVNRCLTIPVFRQHPIRMPNHSGSLNLCLWYDKFTLLKMTEYCQIKTKLNLIYSNSNKTSAKWLVLWSQHIVNHVLELHSIRNSHYKFKRVRRANICLTHAV